MAGEAGTGGGRRHDALWPWASRRACSVKQKKSRSSSRQKLFSLGVARNPLKSPEADEGIQGNPKESKEIQAVFLGFLPVRLGIIWFGLESYGRAARHHSENANTFSECRWKRGFGWSAQSVASEPHREDFYLRKPAGADRRPPRLGRSKPSPTSPANSNNSFAARGHDPT